MAAAGTAAARKGPSVADITRKLATPYIQPPSRERITINSGEVGNGVQSRGSILDDVREFTENNTRQKLAAAAIAQVEAEAEAISIDAESKKDEAAIRMLENKIKLQQLADSQAPEPAEAPGMSPEQMMLFEMFKMFMGKQMEDKPPEPKVDKESLQQIAILQEQLSEMRLWMKETTAARPVEDPMEQMQKNLAMLITMKEMMESFYPKPEPTTMPDATAIAAANAKNDLDTTLLMQKNQIEMARLTHEMEMSRLRLTKEFEQEEKKLDVDREKSANMRQSIEGLMSAMAPLVKEAVDKVIPGGSPNANIPRPIAPNMIPAYNANIGQAPIMPPQVHELPCPEDNCNGMVKIFDGQTTAMCGDCGMSREIVWQDNIRPPAPIDLPMPIPMNNGNHANGNGNKYTNISVIENTHEYDEESERAERPL